MTSDLKSKQETHDFTATFLLRTLVGFMTNILSLKSYSFADKVNIYNSLKPMCSLSLLQDIIHAFPQYCDL